MTIHKLTHEDLQYRNLNKFRDVIYDNFIELNNDPKLLHTKEEINKTLNSEDVLLLFSVDKNKKSRTSSKTYVEWKNEKSDKKWLDSLRVKENTSLRNIGVVSEYND